MVFSFEKLPAYRSAIELISLIYRIALKLPPHEEEVLKPRLLRAATSIALQVAEGSGRGGKEFGQFVRLAFGNLLEVAAILKILLDLGEVEKVEFRKAEMIIKELHGQLEKLWQSPAVNTGEK